MAHKFNQNTKLRDKKRFMVFCTDTKIFLLGNLKMFQFYMPKV